MRPLGWFGTLNALLIGFVKATPPDKQSWQNILSTQEARRRRWQQRQVGGFIGCRRTCRRCSGATLVFCGATPLPIAGGSDAAALEARLETTASSSLVSAMVLKALVDKTHSGALIASLSTPLASKSAQRSSNVGYRAVRSRDFYCTPWRCSPSATEYATWASHP